MFEITSKVKEQMFARKAAGVRNSVIYARGYLWRSVGFPDLVTEVPYWRTGWQAADMELLASQGYYDARVDSFERGAVLKNLGGDARIFGLAFDENRPHAWRDGWIEVDIDLVTKE